MPLFISRRRLVKRRTFPTALGPWALDSGGFTELDLYGKWTLSAADYVAEVRRYLQVGQMAWAAPQDWMCEPFMLEKTGLTVADHQRLTVANYLELRALAPDLPFIPVLQGWEMGDYLDHVEAYSDVGVNLRELPLVGVGSVCRRQNQTSTQRLFFWLGTEGIKCHGFGLKTKGLALNTGCLGAADGVGLVSADSLAWSANARRREPLPGCPHKSCANCLKYALLWRQRLPGEWITEGGQQ